MKSKILFVLTVMSFFNPVAGMAGQKTSYAGDLKVGCNKWAEKRLSEIKASSAEDKIPLSSAGSNKVAGSAK